MLLVSCASHGSLWTYSPPQAPARLPLSAPRKRPAPGPYRGGLAAPCILVHRRTGAAGNLGSAIAVDSTRPPDADRQNASPRKQIHRLSAARPEGSRE